MFLSTFWQSLLNLNFSFPPCAYFIFSPWYLYLVFLSHCALPWFLLHCQAASDYSDSSFDFRWGTGAVDIWKGWMLHGAVRKPRWQWLFRLFEQCILSPLGQSFGKRIVSHRDSLFFSRRKWPYLFCRPLVKPDWEGGHITWTPFCVAIMYFIFL